MAECDSIINAPRPDFKPAPSVDYATARACRRNDFWRPLLKNFFSGYSEKSNAAEETEMQRGTMRFILDDLKERVAKLSKGDCQLPLVYASQRIIFGAVMHILAFDVNFKYRLQEPEDERDASDTDTLREEGVFRCEVCSALDAYILEGATLAKSAGSDSYAIWRRALINLSLIENGLSGGEDPETIVRECMASIIDAQQALWADMRVNAKLDAKLFFSKGDEIIADK